jgi:tetratricopeptide (TPR) repeat protein
MRFFWSGLLVVAVFSSKPVFSFAQDGADDLVNDASQILKRGTTLLQRGEYFEARLLLEDVLVKNPSNYKALELLGDVWLIGYGKHEKSIEFYNLSIKSNPRQPIVYLKLAHLYAVEGKLKQAQSVYDKAIQYDAKDPRLYYGRAMLFLDQRQYSTARIDFERAWELGLKYPTSYALAKLLAMCPDAGVRDGAKAIKYAKNACENTQFKDPASLGVLAAAFAEDGKWEDAIRVNEDAIRYSQGGFCELLKLTLELFKLHEPYHERGGVNPSTKHCRPEGYRPSTLDSLSINTCNSANASSRKPIESNPRLAGVYYRLGMFFTFRDTDQAIGHFTRSLDLDRTNPETYARRAEAHILLGNIRYAIEDAKSALTLNSNHFNARVALVWCLSSIDEPNLAAVELGKLNKSHTDHESVHLLKGHCCLNQARLKEALDELSIAIQRSSGNALGYSDRAVVLCSLGWFEEAADDLEKCCLLAPALRVGTESRMKAASAKYRLRNKSTSRSEPSY